MGLLKKIGFATETNNSIAQYKAWLQIQEKIKLKKKGCQLIRKVCQQNILYFISEN